MTVPFQDHSADRDPALLGAAAANSEVLCEEAFKRMISVERKRTERSAKPFLLMLLEASEHCSEEKNEGLLSRVIAAMLRATRETDVIGWHKSHSSVGVLFTELATFDQKTLLSTMLARISGILRDNLSIEQFSQITISFHFFPDKWDQDHWQRPSNPTLYPDLPRNDGLAGLHSVTKRVMDIGGSLLLLALGSPLLIAVALAVKLSSKGPVFFRQQRVGQFGKPFTFFKFRSMYVDNDPTVHKNYVTAS